jgi:signal transduction histidine kinase
MRFVSGMSVRAKAVLAAAGTVAFAVALCMLALVLALQHNLRDSANKDAEHAAAAIQAQLPPAAPFEKAAGAGRTLVATSGAVTIRDASGQIIGGTPAKPTATLKGTGGKHTMRIRPPEHAVPPKDSGSIALPSKPNTTYSVDVSPSTTALRNATGFLLHVAAPSAAGLVVFVAALTWLLVGRALRPVAAIRQEVTEITERDMHRRVPVPGTRDEISRLARTMNTTLDRLHRAMTRQRQFVADASHELRSPIAAVRTQLELALARPSRTDWPTAVHRALQDTERLQTVASDLLLLARLDAAEAPPRSPVDLAALTSDEVRRHPGTITAGWGSPRGGGPGGGNRAAVVTGSRIQLSRLLTNLADNARRHARTSVSITVDVRGATVQLAVDDDGLGIPEADRERVFERFTRLDSARARQDGGTGLGLAIAKDIAHAHGGTLTAHTSPRGGARLLLCLPSGGSAAASAAAARKISSTA